MAKILIVDDEAKIRQLYSRFLTLENYEVVAAEDVQAATRCLLNDPDVSLVLLDINLPQLDGGVLYQLIRRFDSRIKVIVISAYALDDQKRKVVHAEDYYDKSQSTEVLLEKVKRVMGEVKHEAR